MGEWILAGDNLAVLTQEKHNVTITRKPLPLPDEQRGGIGKIPKAVTGGMIMGNRPNASLVAV